MFLNQTYRNSLFLRNHFYKQSAPILYNSSYLSLIKRKPTLLSKKDYKLLYEFHFIKLTGALIRSGRTTVFLGFLSSPFAYYYYNSYLIPLAILGSACVHYAMVYGFSQVFNNVVGKMYVDKEGDVKNVMISSLDQYGRRIDRIHSVDTLINCEFPTKVKAHLGFMQVGIENSDYYYQVNVRNCKIFDPAVWDFLFGKISLPVPVKKLRRKEAKKISK